MVKNWREYKPAGITNRPAKVKGYRPPAGLGVKREYILAGISGGNIWREYNLKFYYTLHCENYSKMYDIFSLVSLY